MKRVGLDVRQTRQMSAGMKEYTTELGRRLPAVAPDLEFVAFEHGANFTLDEQLHLPRAMRAAKLDLVHFTALYAPFFAPRPYVVTIHDLIHLRFPQLFKTKVGPYYRTVVRRLVKRAARIITDDPRTVADLERFLGADPAKCRVIPLGVDDRYLAPVTPYRAEQPYLLYSGNHRAHKDLPTLFEAWAALPDRMNVDLYLTGPDDFGGALRAYQRPNRQVVALGDVPPEKMPALYAGAAALVHPALCEGFGLPMLEAMAAGTPVIATFDAAPAVLQSAMLLFDAGDRPGLRARIERVLTDEGLRAAFVNEGRMLAGSLTWERCARETAAVYRDVLAERP